MLQSQELKAVFLQVKPETTSSRFLIFSLVSGGKWGMSIAQGTMVDGEMGIFMGRIGSELATFQRI